VKPVYLLANFLVENEVTGMAGTFEDSSINLQVSLSKFYQLFREKKKFLKH